MKAPEFAIFDGKVTKIRLYHYYDNSAACGECNGNGCRWCIGGLSGTGNSRFPLSRAINGCQPPYIAQPYAWKHKPRTAEYCIKTL